MTKETYKTALDSALKDLADLMSQREELDTKRDELDKEIFQLREGLFGLAILCGTDTNHLAALFPELFPDLISPDTGLTDAIRKALQAKRTFVSPVEVKNRLVEMGYDIGKYKNVLASIHTILKRLVDSEEVEAGNRDGKVVYRAKSVTRVAPMSAGSADGGARNSSLSSFFELTRKAVEKKVDDPAIKPSEKKALTDKEMYEEEVRRKDGK